MSRVIHEGPPDDETVGFRFLLTEWLDESKANPRTRFDEKALDALADSIRAHGVLTPLLVRPILDGTRFEIAAGHRRFRAAQRAGLDAVPCVVREMTDVELLEILVVENNQREDVHPLEEAQGYRALVDAGYNAERIAERLGRNRSYVFDRMKLLSLVKECRTLFFDGKLTTHHAILLARLQPADQRRAIDPETGGLFTREDIGEGSELKPVSTREFAAWVDECVRLDPTRPDVRELYPETAAAIQESAEKAEKVVPITRDYQLDPAAKTEQRVLTARAWKRADGGPDESDHGSRPRRSKTCETSVLGVIVIGRGRGEAFHVCIDKFCETHWGQEQRANAKAATKRAPAAVEQKRLEAERAAWERARPEVLLALASKIGAAPLKAVGEAVQRACLCSTPSPIHGKAFLPTGNGADAMLRRFAFYALVAEVSDSGQLAPMLLRPFGVDVAKIVKAAEKEKA